jgi:hypothetical protein
MSKKRSLKHARPDGSQGRPDGQRFPCLKSNSGIFRRAVWMGKCFSQEGGYLDASNGHPDAQFIAYF